MIVTEFLSLKGLFLCLRILTHFPMGKMGFCSEKPWPAQPANPTCFSKGSVCWKKIIISHFQHTELESHTEGRHGKTCRKNHSSKELPNSVLLPSLIPFVVGSYLLFLDNGDTIPENWMGTPKSLTKPSFSEYKNLPTGHSA